MKKVVTIFLAFLTLIPLTSCSKKINNEFFSTEILVNYGLSSNFPLPNVDTTSLMDSKNLYVYLNDDEYEDYCKCVYEYLLDNDYFYVGTFEQNGLIAEMLPAYYFESISQDYDFGSQDQKFIYSTQSELFLSPDGHPLIKPCYVIYIKRVEETKYSLFSSKTYNTKIYLGTKSVYYSDPEY